MKTNSHQHTIFCIASYFKGNDFLRECKSTGHRVILFTREKMLEEDWARESLDGLIRVSNDASIEAYIYATSEFARTHKPTHVIALEESDVITAGRLREHFCLGGMWSSHARLFRDKLAMRQKAQQHGIIQPAFVHALNYQEVGEFMERINAPWVIKPRADASAIGIKKFEDSEQVWRTIDALNANEVLLERAAFYLLEEFIEGDVYHVDSLVSGGEVVFACVNRYGKAPLSIVVHGGVATSYTLEYGGQKERKELLEANNKIIAALALMKGVTHAEFIKSRENGAIYFLEIGARVGGAYTAEAFEAASGLNIWREWARIEMSPDDKPYISSPTRFDYSGIVVSLARQEYPDTSSYTDVEIFHRARKQHHVGLVLRSHDFNRIQELLKDYTKRFAKDFTATAPQQERPE